MTRVLFDLAATQGYGTTRFHGGGEYAKRVFRECVATAPSGTVIEAHLTNSRFTDRAVVEFAVENGVKVHYVDRAEELERLLSERVYDRYYSALPAASNWHFEVPLETKFIFTLHGVRGILTQDWRLRTRYGRNALHGLAMAAFFLLLGRARYRRIGKKFARKISATANREVIAVSNYGKYSFMAAIPGVDLTDVRVLDSVTERESPAREAEILQRASLSSRKFFLVVSANRYEKNGFRALKALDRFFTDTLGRPELSDYRVAVTGLRADSRFVRLLRLENPQRFEFLDYVSPGEIEELYGSACALVYASISEGYGYPPVQAMRYGTPSICAGGTSIPEICGDAAIYFNPYDIEEIVARLYEIVEPDVRSWLIPKLAPRERLLRDRQEGALRVIREMIVGRSAE